MTHEHHPVATFDAHHSRLVRYASSSDDESDDCNNTRRTCGQTYNHDKLSCCRPVATAPTTDMENTDAKVKRSLVWIEDAPIIEIFARNSKITQPVSDMGSRRDGDKICTERSHTHSDTCDMFIKRDSMDEHLNVKHATQAPPTLTWYSRCVQSGFTPYVADTLLQLVARPHLSAIQRHSLAEQLAHHKERASGSTTLETAGAIAAATLIAFLDVCKLCPQLRAAIHQRLRHHRQTDRPHVLLLNTLDLLTPVHDVWIRCLLSPAVVVSSPCDDTGNRCNDQQFVDAHVTMFLTEMANMQPPQASVERVTTPSVFTRLPDVWPPLMEELDAQLVHVLNQLGGHAVHLTGSGRRQLPGTTNEVLMVIQDRKHGTTTCTIKAFATKMMTTDDGQRDIDNLVTAVLRDIVLPCVNTRSFYMQHSVQAANVSRSVNDIRCVMQQLLSKVIPDDVSAGADTAMVDPATVVKRAVADLQECAYENNLSQAHWFAREFVFASSNSSDHGVSVRGGGETQTPVDASNWAECWKLCDVDLPKFTQTGVRATKRCCNIQNVMVRPITRFMSPRAIRLEVRVVIPAFLSHCELHVISPPDDKQSPVTAALSQEINRQYCVLYGLHAVLLLLQQYRVGYSLRRPPLHLMRIILRLIQMLMMCTPHVAETHQCQID